MTKPAFIPSIGIECHVQLNTKTKLFSAVSNDSREAPPNVLISHIDLGMPGALPVLNEAAVHKAIQMAFAFGTTPQKHSVFERKHYFYPDLPKGYQITQLHEPIIKGGSVKIMVNGTEKTVRINRVQLEEDAGKSIHPDGKDYSLVDLNRVGTPLLEIVSEPDMHSPEEAKAYAKELYLLVRYAGVSDADMYHGNMRFDVNVSVSAVPGKLGTRTETKNLNSFRSVEKAVAYEIKRQTELLAQGKSVVQETRGWDEAKQKTFAQRTKEEAHDYRYFPDPDLPPLELDDKLIKRIKESLPVMPWEWRRRLQALGLDAKQTEILLDAEIEHQPVSYLRLLEEKLQAKEEARALANWFVNIEVPLRRNGEAQLSDEKARRLVYSRVFDLLAADKLSSTAAKSLLANLLRDGLVPEDMEKYAEEQGFIQVSDESELKKLVQQVIAQQPKAVADIKNGEEKAVGFLVGQVMKESLGKANPQLVRKIIIELVQ